MDTFNALAEPTRRNILEMLVANDGISAGDIYGKFKSSPPTISQHLKDVQVHVEAALRAAGNPRHEAEYRLRAADGRWVWVCTRGGVVRWDVAGRPLLTVGTLTDISERKHAELLLQTQHEFSGILAEGPNREMLLEAILDSALHLPELDGGGVYWREPDGGYRLVARRGLSAVFFAQVG